MGGLYFRVAEPDWRDPTDATYAQKTGGRWNAPGTHATLYLNADVQTARANVRHKFRGLPYGPEDLDPADAPHLVHMEVADGTAADAVTDEGLLALGLPVSYPLDPDGQVIPWKVCWPIGATVFSEQMDGVLCRSAAEGGNQELAYFVREQLPVLGARLEFSAWYWSE